MTGSCGVKCRVDTSERVSTVSIAILGKLGL